MWVELSTISALILLNGFFACAELAIVNTRRSRIKQLVKEKNVSARFVQGFQEDSERFLATTQIGITVAGASAAAMGGVVAIDHLKPVFDKTQQELIHSVFEFTDMSVKEVMIPRPKMCAIEIDTPTPDLLKYIDENKFSRYPVYRKGLNDLLGILYQKDLLSQVAAGKPLNLKDLLHPVYYVPEAMKVSVLLKEMQRRRIHMAIVVNEYGSVEGLVALDDLIEEIVGEIQDEYDTEEKPVERVKDGAILVDASMPVKDLVSEYGLQIPASPDYETLSGFVTSQIQGLPRGGEVFYRGDYKFTVVDLGDRRVSKVKVERIAEQSKVVKETIKTGPK